MKRLMMIDDDEKLVSLVKEYLEPHGFEIDARHDGEGGVEAVLAFDPDLVILDLMLPGVDGLELCRRLRGSSRVPILMLTAKGDETDRIVGLEMGADDYLPKPFNPRELLARVRAVLRRGGGEQTPEPSAVVQAGPLLIDPGARKVTVRGVEVDLTTAEFDILHALASSAGRVLSRERLLEQIHGQGWAAYDRSIDVHMSRIRQKIEEDPRRPTLLKTVRGVGYQLCREEG